MPRVDIAAIAPRVGSGYPAPFGDVSRTREKRALGDAGGLTQFGVNLVRLAPGEWSSQRHWHAAEDEFVFVLAGELTLVTQAGEEPLRAGDCAAFKAGVEDGHHLVNRSPAAATYLEVGSRRDDDAAAYPDIDMVWPGKHGWYTKKDGTPYPRP